MGRKIVDAPIEDTYRYKSTDAALYLVARANERRVALNITKVQKLLYIAYGAFLRVYNERLVNEHPEAWPYGPVFPTMRKELLHTDLYAITEADVPAEELARMEEDRRFKGIVDFTLREFGAFSAGQLTAWSHLRGSPWDVVSREWGFEWGEELSDYDIREYFRGVVRVEGEA